jgi:hypothetical protein
VPLGALDCPQCHALLHSEELLRISTKANQLEEQNALAEARDEWRKALALLPHNSNQAEWIRGKIYKLELTEKHAPTQPLKSEWAKRLGPLAPIAILLAKSKGLLLALFKLKFLLSFFAFLALYWTLYGFKFGVGFVVLILVHELGHYIDIRRRGLPADMPVFLPGLGAYVRWNALGVTRQTRAAVSLAGPLAGLLGAALCAYLWHRTGYGLWSVLARVSAVLNILNLTRSGSSTARKPPTLSQKQNGSFSWPSLLSCGPISARACSFWSPPESPIGSSPKTSLPFPILASRFTMPRCSSVLA